ncbi:acyltransferase family protein [Nocardia ignorata]|uniref:Acyltransferase-like protein n=1 Tax=Nocardia ignorata TaxID=145285 RepID=A0A4R6PR18_NOCIG|nr:acyltransferase [Nocardia ignorata]TDP41078.1 acyltransferase-like protein [Nocardia ignorata]
MSVVPSVAVVAANTPADRDRFLDLLRISSLVVVVVGHCLMLTVSASGGDVRFGNVLADLPALQPLTWLLQVLPLFFFAGVAAGARSIAPGTSWGAWLFRRTQRLIRPVGYFLAASAALVFVAGLVLAPGWQRPLAITSVQLLWFLGMYLAVLACTPLLATWVTGTGRMFATIATIVLATAIVDAVRLGGGPAEAGFLNLVVWLIPAVLGIGYLRGLLSRRVAALLAGVVLLVDVALVVAGPYDTSMVTVPGQRLSNLAPPSLLLAGHAMVLCCAAIAVAPWLRRVAARPRVWWLTVIGNTGAMTLYLWHMPVLLTVLVLSHLLGFDRGGPSEAGFWLLTVGQLTATAALTAVLFVALRGLENTPLRWWDGPVAPVRGLRSAAVVLTVGAAGLAILQATRGGLTPEGLPWFAGAATALFGARLLTRA